MIRRGPGDATMSMLRKIPLRKLAVLAFAVVPALAALAAAPARAEWAAPQAPAIPAADGAVLIPGVAVPPVATRTYRAVVEATQAADSPGGLVPGLNMAGSELNTLAVWGVPTDHLKMAIVFHGPSVDGILNEATYRAKFGVANPNLPLLAQLKKAGVPLYVCGQHLAAAGIDPKNLAPEIAVA